MSGRGPAPKDPTQRRRRNKDQHAELPADGELRGPELPATYRSHDGENALTVRYLAPTRAWWDTWRASPQAAQFSGTDWQRLLMLAPLVDAYLRVPTVKGHTEIRLAESLFGATVVDRMRLRWELERPEPETQPATRASRYQHLQVVDG